MQSEYEKTGKLQRKIDIFRRNPNGRPADYVCSTNWHKTCKEALRDFLQARNRDGAYFARFAK